MGDGCADLHDRTVRRLKAKRSSFSRSYMDELVDALHRFQIQILQAFLASPIWKRLD
jgi:hypothetical protein